VNPLNLLFGPYPSNPVQLIIYILIIWVPYILLMIYWQTLQGHAMLGDINRYLMRLK
jgi:hypothetical protein